jgi:hypothetical protein
VPWAYLTIGHRREQSHAIHDRMIRPGPTRARSRSAPGNTTNSDAAPP